MTSLAKFSSIAGMYHVREFSFNSFLVFGGISDVFVDRSYGPNHSSHSSTSWRERMRGLLNLGPIKLSGRRCSPI
jgi:hypothetical protein